MKSFLLIPPTKLRKGRLGVGISVDQLTNLFGQYASTCLPLHPESIEPDPRLTLLAQDRMSMFFQVTIDLFPQLAIQGKIWQK